MKFKIETLLIVIFFFYGSYAHAQITNLLINGGFEDGQTAWGEWGAGITISGDSPYNGNNCVRFTARTILEQSPVTLEAGKTYKLSVWIRINSMAGSDWGGIRFNAVEYDWSGWYYSDSYTTQNRPVGEWFNEVVTFVPATDQVRIQIGFFGGAGWTPDYSYDDIILFEELEENIPPVIDSVRVNPVAGSVPFLVTGEIFARDDDGVIENYIVDMGDGAVYTNSPVFTHTYRIPGNYTLTMLVTDDVGDMDTTTVQITAGGTNDHSVSITFPQAGGGSDYNTSSDIVYIEGTRLNGDGTLFWINNRTMQSGYIPVVNNSFLIPEIVLDVGINKIHIQSHKGDGTYVLDEINIRYEPNDYSGPQISGLQVSKTSLKQYERADISFNVQTIADNLFFPFDQDKPANLNTGSGISVDMEFTQGTTVLVQPAFLNMDYSREGEKLLPTGQWVWSARMAFRETGNWTSRIIARDAAGITEFSGPAFVVEADSLKDGYIKVSDSDNRYFEYDNGKPFFAMGHGTTVSNPDAVDEEIGKWQEHKLNFGRFWLSSNAPFSDSWSSWATHHAMPGNGYMPPPLLTHNQKYANGQFSWRLASPAIEDQNTPAIFRGFWDGSIPAKPQTTYRIIARVKTINIQGAGGLVLKTGGWLGTAVVNPGTGTVFSPYMRGDNDWTYLTGTIVTASNQNSIEYIYLVLEDCTGEAFLDQMTIQEVSSGGNLQQNILSKWNANTHHYLDPIRSREADYMIGAADTADIHYKVVIHEKDDFICNRIDNNGFVSTTNGNFDQPEGTPLRRLYEYYWRNLVARWGYARSVHSWELVNEGAPGSYMDLTNSLADFFNSHSPYPRLVSTSFWSNWEPEYWASSEAGYADIHAYIMTTGWIDTITIDGQFYNREALRNDAAAAVYAYSVTVGTDPERNKPVILGETDLDIAGSQDPDPLLASDTSGIWLHNFNWGHINHGGMQSLIWNSDNIRNNDLFYRYRGFQHFMQDIPLTTGAYQALNAISSNPALRVWGQVQTSGNAAHFWVQNRNHTWRNVVLNGNPSPQSGVITLQNLAPGPMVIERWNSWSEDTVPEHTDTVIVNNTGTYQINISELVTDLAFKFYNENAGADLVVNYDWPQFQRDAARTGRTDLSVAPPYRARWIWTGPGQTLRNMQSEPGWSDDLTTRDGYSYPLPDTMHFTISGSVQPVIKGSRLYFCTMEGDAYALDIHNGATLWNAMVTGGSLVSAGVLEDVVIFAGARGVVYAFDTLTGDLRWEYNTKGSVTTAPCIIAGSVIIANHKGKVVRLSTSGNVIWEIQLSAPVAGGITAHGGSVYVPAENMVVYSIHLMNGSIQASEQVRGQSFRACHPVVFNGRVYITSVTVPIVGSEYIMEEVMAASGSLEEEEENIRLWLQGNNNNGTWPNASPDWQHVFALDATTLENLFLIPAGPVDGCGIPAPSVVIDNQDRALRWWKTRFPFLTAQGPAFGTNYTIDIAGINPLNGNRVPVNNSQLSNMWPLETDNLYGLTVGGDYLWMRQNFRGTQVINLSNSQHVLAQVTTRYNDGGSFGHAHVCYRNNNLNNGIHDVPYIVSQSRTMGRNGPAIAGKYVFLAEEFAIVAIENY